MKAVRIHQFGGPEVLKYETNVPVPQPGPGEVLVNVKVVGLNPAEIFVRVGSFGPVNFPGILGRDSAGVVTKVGSDVTQFKAGDRVFTSNSTSGVYAEYTVSSASSVHHLPSKLSFIDGAALPSYRSAYHALFQLGSGKPGETVLIHGASGGVGVAAVQFARALGLRVFGTAGTKEGLELVKKAGAHSVFNHREEGYLEKIREEAGESGVNLLIENAAHINLGKDLTILPPRGRIVVVGTNGPPVQINPLDAVQREASITGMFIPLMTPEELAESFAAIQGGIEAGWLRPIVGKKFPLKDASKAHSDTTGGSGALGKTVLVVN